MILTNENGERNWKVKSSKKMLLKMRKWPLSRSILYRYAGFQTPNAFVPHQSDTMKCFYSSIDLQGQETQMTKPETQPLNYDRINAVKKSLAEMCENQDFSGVVKEVASQYQPLVAQLEDDVSQENTVFHAGETARIEEEAIALLVQNGQFDLALLLYENLKEMAYASELVQPLRKTFSFIVGAAVSQKKWQGE